MWKLVVLVALCSLGSGLGALVAPNALSLRVSNKTTHEIPSTLYGYMWEARSSNSESLFRGTTDVGLLYRISIRGIVATNSSFKLVSHSLCARQWRWRSIWYALDRGYWYHSF